MKMAVVTLFPEMFDALLNHGISGRAVKRGLLEVVLLNPRDYTSDRHQSVDDRPYGGGPGMVMTIEPLRGAISDARQRLAGSREDGQAADVKVVYLSPQGRLLSQAAVNDFAAGSSDLVLVAGRYEGIDERLLSLEVDEEWSVGDYVLSGGELPAMVLMDAIIRQLPGALGHQDSAAQDSFAEGLLDCPHYTRPEDYQGMRVPEVLLSGDHERIRRWRLQQSLLRTRARRPDLLAALAPDSEYNALLAESGQHQQAGGGKAGDGEKN
jgi:tRNA (guanine37-N1)-methyltransferase